MVRGIGIASALLASLWAVEACKTTDKKKADSAGLVNQVSGTLDDKGQMLIKVPDELNGFRPTATMTTKPTVTPQISGLSLTGAPVSSSDPEAIEVNCYTNDSLFIGKGWYFYAALRRNGQTVGNP